MQALYILKRCGYDASSFIKTLSLITQEEDDIELLSIAKECIDDHPRIISRVMHLQDRIFWFEKDFAARYQKVQTVTDSSFLSTLRKFFSFGS